MKSSCRQHARTVVIAGALLAGISAAQAQIEVKVDTTKPWQGYMNVFNLPDYSGGYLWGSAWGAADLSASFSGVDTLTLAPNSNTYAPGDTYWVNPDGTGNKFMEANFYVQDESLRGQTVTFSGIVLSNSLVGGASGHLTRAFVKTLDSAAGYSLVPDAYLFVDLTNSATPYSFSITVNVPAGASMVPQYGFVTTGPNVNPAWMATNGIVVLDVQNSDPAITGQPSNQRVLVGGTASFSVAATGTAPLSYQWKHFGTNLTNGGRISGATSSTLVISNAQLADVGSYAVTVTSGVGPLDSNPAVLRVKTAAEYANWLENPGFDEPAIDPVTQIASPWNVFAGGGIRSTNDLYAFDPNFPVQTLNGTNAGYAYNGGEWNGIFQDVPASPGDVFLGDANFYLPSAEQIFGDMTAWLEVQFRAGGTVLSLYKSAIINDTWPRDLWFSLSATNGFAGDFNTPIPNARYLVAPEGTTTVRYQITAHAVGGPSGTVNFDAMQLIKIIPVTVASASASGDVAISWQSFGGASYQVVYKENINDPTWTPVGPVVNGDGTVKSASFPASDANGFYAVQTF